jgi:four helix bundle protein
MGRMIYDFGLTIYDYELDRYLTSYYYIAAGETMVNEQQFRERTKKLGVRIIRMVESLPESRAADVIGRQILPSATSVGANYRAACRAKSAADIINKLKIVEEEADETLYWQELLIEAELVSEARLADLMKETDEILAMTVASIKTLRAKHYKS